MKTRKQFIGKTTVPATLRELNRSLTALERGAVNLPTRIIKRYADAPVIKPTPGSESTLRTAQVPSNIPVPPE